MLVRNSFYGIDHLILMLHKQILLRSMQEVHGGITGSPLISFAPQFHSTKLSQSIKISEGLTAMTLKTFSSVTLAASLVAMAASVASAKPLPADQFHWSSVIQNGSFSYNGKTYSLQGKISSEAEAFIANCSAQEVRVRGFLTAQGNEDYSKAELLCGKLSVGGDTPVAYHDGGEIKVFGPIYLTQKNNVLPDCQPYSNSSARVWNNCGAIVPNDNTSTVLIGDGRNAGKALETARLGSGIETVKPILFPEVEELREKIFRERLAAGYYNN
jgi:hypothetical protein